MSTKHTPGPWRAVEIDGVEFFILPSGDLPAVASGHGNGRNISQLRADAALLADAPAMLKALSDFAQYVNAGDDVPLAAMIGEAQAICKRHGII